MYLVADRPTSAGCRTRRYPSDTTDSGWTLLERWVVERIFFWITQARRNVRDYERLPDHSEAFIHNSMITLMIRRLTR
ncbi:transposon Tn5714 transposase [Amycolatopsis decaplanina DSM 44594]|uniref:Transposon Tn5714 transposase n=1 Tax=Amycolatopsis decaplanina DSM 44594 TaxID=1284240 RepID=M2Z8G5_9PSEU|nr:transposon Tn5714 transposase [Amycolatopsis decaplanina DSM 44594]